MNAEAKPIIVTSRELPPLFQQALAQMAEVRVAGEPAAKVYSKVRRFTSAPASTRSPQP